MPSLEINQTCSISASVRMHESTAEQVDQYAASVYASVDGVVDKALKHVFSKDPDFQDFLKKPQAKHVASKLRVRKCPSYGAAGSLQRRSCEGAIGVLATSVQS